MAISLSPSDNLNNIFQLISPSIFSIQFMPIHLTIYMYISPMFPQLLLSNISKLNSTIWNVVEAQEIDSLHI